MKYDKIILGGGIFGLYAALKCIQKGQKVLILEHENAPFKRASWINQARVHNGYHYPRSYATALKSAYYFDRFVDEFDFAILKRFTKIYALANQFSYTNAEQFSKFCHSASIPIAPITASKYFKKGSCDNAFETLEYAFDAKLIGEYLLSQLNASGKCDIYYKAVLDKINHSNQNWQLISNHGHFTANYLINATYASLNQVLTLCGLETLNLKYELCEIALCNVSSNIKDIGITLMDGPFFSLMPFGKSGYHSLTSVMHTPHNVSIATHPNFSCQNNATDCRVSQLANCNLCAYKPSSAFAHMRQLVKRYLNDQITLTYHKSLYAVKAILQSSEVDDARPTLIKKSHTNPDMLSIFSGKINTIYDLEEVL
ncbi:MAG: FAD-binding oxidoreductase [Gammaproteobacteria bacterium]|nr:MAG: FAD-binding oxidoreductase [Gammaproteobacteria bacterium]UTW44095.1 FAD-binding oxidoreductase [bacterium SCSIO 12844]